MSQFTVAWRNAVWELFMCKFTVKTPDFSDSEVPKWGPGPLGFGLKNFAVLHASMCTYVTAVLLREHGGVVGGCIRDPRTKTSYASWFFGKLAVQSS